MKCPTVGRGNSKSPPPVHIHDLKRRDGITNPVSSSLLLNHKQVSENPTIRSFPQIVEGLPTMQKGERERERERERIVLTAFLRKVLVHVSGALIRGIYQVVKAHLTLNVRPC